MTLRVTWSAHRQAAVIESVIDPAGNGSVLIEEPCVDQTPKVEDTADNIRIPTNIDAGRRAIPLVPGGLLGFVERWVGYQFSGGVEGATCIDVEGMPIGRNAENDLISREASGGPSLHGRHSGSLLVFGRRA